MAAQSFQLVMRTGPIPGKIFDLASNELSIGRDISNDIVISDVEVSRKHARLIMQPDGFVLEDMGSTNGTFVNGQRLVSPRVLRGGETVMLGENVSLVFEAAYDADATVVSSPAYEPAPETVYASPQPPMKEHPVASRQAGVESSPQVYAGQVPAGPADLPEYADFTPEEKPAKKTWIWVGCGCLVLLCIGVAIGAYAFDALNLYCTPPFNNIFYCP
ncbi:MAG: FHA domain-containing protein [Anaerolineales bacterium]|nr:FHA domain-containing protein [Anaerolineales bacterium]